MYLVHGIRPNLENVMKISVKMNHELVHFISILTLFSLFHNVISFKHGFIIKNSLRISPRHVLSMSESTLESCQWSPIPYTNLTIGVPAERTVNERRVGLAPESASLLIKEGFRVCVENGAGIPASFSNQMYERVGAEIVDNDFVWKSDIIVKVCPPHQEEVEKLENRAILSFIQPSQNENTMKLLQVQGSTAFAMDCIPRLLSRGQAFDALSSQVLFFLRVCFGPLSNYLPTFSNEIHRLILLAIDQLSKLQINLEDFSQVRDPLLVQNSSLSDS